MRMTDYAVRAALILVVFLWTFGLLASCGPTATERAIAEIHGRVDTCGDEAIEIARTATSGEQAEQQIAELRDRCIADGRAYCAEHHLDCSSFLPPESP